MKTGVSVERKESSFDSLFWQAFSRSVEIDWDINLLKRFEHNLNWEILSENNSLPWGEELINTFAKRWNWSSVSERISGFSSWEIDEHSAVRILHNNKNSLNWAIISGGHSINQYIVNSFPACINWDVLSSNFFFPWSVDFLMWYKHRINWTKFSQILHPEIIGLTDCEFTEFLMTFKEQIDWTVLSSNTYITFDDMLICVFKDLWNWNLIYYNTNIKNREQIVEHYCDRKGLLNHSIRHSLEQSKEILKIIDML
ncbi:hypothetical protein CYCD_29800 [Tenuifilaceae bacterium CYCD]|nr:hypothetical protein CYCD_29800 [Tenuifilaceae bacterium CYCD]